MAWEINSSAFGHYGNIPKKYTCQGEDLSPPIKWGPPPAGTKSIALICDDPDAPAGTWVHWVAWNIPAETVMLEEGIAPKATEPEGIRQGTNDFNRVGYGGPCPPPGGAHRYYFKLYALDTLLELSSEATKEDLLAAMKGHVIQETEMVGNYKRR